MVIKLIGLLTAWPSHWDYWLYPVYSDRMFGAELIAENCEVDAVIYWVLGLVILYGRQCNGMDEIC